MLRIKTATKTSNWKSQKYLTCVKTKKQKKFLVFFTNTVIYPTEKDKNINR